MLSGTRVGLRAGMRFAKRCRPSPPRVGCGGRVGHALRSLSQAGWAILAPGVGARDVPASVPALPGATVTYLLLRPGPVLVRVDPSENAPSEPPSPPRPGPESSRGSGPSPSSGPGLEAEAAAWLFQPLRLEAGVTLGDLLALFDACPALLPIYARERAADWCAQARRGALPGGRPAGVSFLELRRSWFFDSHTRTYSDVHRLALYGVSAPVPGTHGAGGTRWGLSGVSLRALLEVPVRMAEDINVFESDRHALRNNDLLRTVRCVETRLGDVLHAVLQGLACIDDEGTPARCDAARGGAEPEAALEDAGWSAATTVDDLLKRVFGREFEHAVVQACAAMFASLGPHSPRAVWRAAQRVPDRRNAARWLRAELGEAVVVHEPFAGFNGRRFREAFRAIEDALA